MSASIEEANHTQNNYKYTNWKKISYIKKHISSALTELIIKGGQTQTHKHAKNNLRCVSKFNACKYFVIFKK